jgi:hypothetical protein
MDLILTVQYFGLVMLSIKLLHLFRIITFQQFYTTYQTHKINIVEKILVIKIYIILMLLALLPRMIQLFAYNSLAIPMI